MYPTAITARPPRRPLPAPSRALALALAAGLAPLAHDARAQGLPSQKKEVTWTCPGPLPANARGEVTWKVNASAKTSDPGSCHHFGKDENSTTWLLTDGFDLPFVDSQQQSCPPAFARAGLDFHADPPVFHGPPPGTTTLEGYFISGVYALIDDCPPKKREATASSWGRGYIKGMTGSYTLASDRRGQAKANGVTYPVLGGTDDGKNENAEWKDPVVLELRTAAGALVAQDTLFTQRHVVVGDASMSWDQTALTITAPADGFSRVSISATYPGAWVTSSIGPFGASLAGGVFTPTGAWAALPWNLSFQGGQVVGASLPAAAIPDPTLDYEIPAALIVPTNTYYTALAYTTEFDAAVAGDAGCGDLWNNMRIDTDDAGACLPPGTRASEVPAGGILRGISNQLATGVRVTDDFAVDQGGWNITGVDFYLYQTGANPAASPITAVNCRIWNGPPWMPGSAVVAGDATTNRLAGAEFSGYYRYLNGACALDRPVFRVSINLPASLPPGGYWLDWQADGLSQYPGPWVPLVTLPGMRGKPGANARYGNNSSWTEAIDTGATPADGPVAQDFPFVILGTTACYANCDGSVTQPVLNVADFTCFLQNFAAGTAYGNCDSSTTPPVLNVADFTCFLQKFASGCS